MIVYKNIREWWENLYSIKDAHIQTKDTQVIVIHIQDWIRNIHDSIHIIFVCKTDQ